MLEIDVNKRPNIFQVSEIAFKLSGKSNPVPNINQASIPSIAELRVPNFESETKRPNSGLSNKFLKPVTSEVGTSVAPRQRPKPTAQATSIHAIALNLPPSPRNVLASPLAINDPPSITKRTQLMENIVLNSPTEKPTSGYTNVTVEKLEKQQNKVDELTGSMSNLFEKDDLVISHESKNLIKSLPVEVVNPTSDTTPFSDDKFDETNPLEFDLDSSFKTKDQQAAMYQAPVTKSNWNPFDTADENVSEDKQFGLEFDKIRQNKTNGKNC